MPDDDFIPARGDHALHHVGSYRRVLPVSLERLYENVLDWERLPHVHGRYVDRVSCYHAGPGGWRAGLVDIAGRDWSVELILDRLCQRWITRIAAGRGGRHGGYRETWTQALTEGARRVDVVVDWFVDSAEAGGAGALGETLARRCRRQYDADVAMMVERQRQLDRRLGAARPGERVLALGPRADLCLPMEVVVGGRELVLVEVEGTLATFPRQCPHQLGPLGAADVNGRVVVCPWHGDRFDLLTGDNLSGRACRLSHRPEIRLDAAGNVTLLW